MRELHRVGDLYRVFTTVADCYETPPLTWDGIVAFYEHSPIDPTWHERAEVRERWCAEACFYQHDDPVPAAHRGCVYWCDVGRELD